MANDVQVCDEEAIPTRIRITPIVEGITNIGECRVVGR